MSGMQIKKYGSYWFGSAPPLTEKQLRQLAEHFHLPAGNAGSILGGRGFHTSVTIDGIGPVVIKHYKRGGLFRHLVKQTYVKWGKTRCQVEYEQLQNAGKMGVSVSEPVAFAYCGEIFYRGWLITREIKHHKSLADLSKKDEKRMLLAMEMLIDNVATLIRNRLFHVDLHPGNVLADTDNHIYIVDFDKARRFCGSRNTLRDKYIRRWKRAVQKHQLPEMLHALMEQGLNKDFDSNHE